MEPSSMRERVGKSCIMEDAVTDLPHPLSPTMHSVLPFLMVKDTFSTARTQLATRWKNPLRTGKYFFRSLTCRILSFSERISFILFSIHPSVPGRRQKVPGSGRYVHLRNHTFPGIVRDRFEWHNRTADETGNHWVYRPDSALFPGCCRAAGPFFRDWEGMPAAPGCKDASGP